MPHSANHDLASSAKQDKRHRHSTFPATTPHSTSPDSPGGTRRRHYATSHATMSRTANHDPAGSAERVIAAAPLGIPRNHVPFDLAGSAQRDITALPLDIPRHHVPFGRARNIGSAQTSQHRTDGAAAEQLPYADRISGCGPTILGQYNPLPPRARANHPEQQVARPEQLPLLEPGYPERSVPRTDPARSRSR